MAMVEVLGYLITQLLRSRSLSCVGPGEQFTLAKSILGRLS
jgi:hypothetical protein